MPTIASFADIHLHTGKQVFAVGRYELLDASGKSLAAGKRPVAATSHRVQIGFDDGSAVDLGDRPAAELALAGKMVIAVGKLVATTTAPDAPRSLTQIESVREADQ